MDYSKEKNLKKLVKFSPQEQMAADDSEALYFAGQSQYEQDSINKAQNMTGENIAPSEDLNSLWESAAPKEDLTALWESATPQTSNKPLSVTRNGKTLTASNKTFQDDLKDELAANPIAAKMAAAGTALSDLYQGGKQLIGMGDDKAIEANRIIREANPLSAVAGNVASFAAGGLAAPVLNTLKGVTALGAATGLAAPVEGEDVARQKIGNAFLGAGVGAGASKFASAVGNKLSQAANNKTVQKTVNSVKDATLKAAQDAGFTIPRSLYNPTFMSNRLESFGGKAAVKQAATDKNQNVVNDLARKALGVSKDAPLSTGTIEQVRKQAYKPYEEVASISKGAANALEDLKQARADATSWFNSYNRSANPEHLAKAQEFREIANVADSVLDDYATQAGKPQLIGQLKEARKTIAKTYTVERALNPANGDIDSRVLARLFEKGKPLSDGLDDIGRFAKGFGQVAPTGKGGSGAGISALDATASLGLGALGAGYSGSPEGAAAGLLPLLLRPASRTAALSKMMQTTPNYSTGKTANLLKALVSSRNAPMAITGATVPSLTK